LSDAPEWLLERYPLLMVAGELEGGAEVRDHLRLREAWWALAHHGGQPGKAPGVGRATS